MEIFQDEFNLVATDLDLERRVKSMSQFLFDTYMMCGKRERERVWPLVVEE